MLFQYPRVPHKRRHGPQGYRRHQSYKPWLRDEYFFRCVYCLCRERWFPDGDDYFGVDHFKPQSQARERRTEYDNLIFACCQCNASKRDCDWLLNPDNQALATHLEVLEDGTIRGLTSEGMACIKVCRLDRPMLTAFRKGLLALVRILAQRPSPEAARVLRHILGFPDNLPNLGVLRPPGGNARPDGVATSAHAQQLQGKLDETY
jgi:hypothetical protein